MDKSLPDPTEGDVYAKLKQKLNNHFTPKKNKHYARYQFLKMKPNTGETTGAYAARLREKAKECEFEANYDDRILEHIIQTIENKTLIQKTISKKWDLAQFLTEASQIEDIARQIKDMKTAENGNPSISRVQSHSRNYKPANRKSFGRPQVSTEKRRQDHNHKPKCEYCGLSDAHEKGSNCPAYGKKCRKCHRYNHFSAVCRAGVDTKKFTKARVQIQKGNIKKAAEDDSTSSDDEYFQQTAAHLRQAKKIKNADSLNRTVSVRLDDVDVEMEPDSGADVNIMDEHQYKAFVHRTNYQPLLEPSKIKLNTLQHRLSVKGQFKSIIRNQTCGKPTTFIVVHGKIHSPPLISKSTLTDLGMLKLDPDGRFAEPNSMRIQSVKQESGKQAMKIIIDQYNRLFQGIGRIRDNKNNKEIYGQFHMKPEAIPVTQKPRPIPYYLKDPLKKWLEQGLEEEIFEKVPDTEPVTWCSPLVVQPKPRFSQTPQEQLEPHMIRASVDLRVPNKYMERSRITQAPIVEDFIHKFHDCTIWTKLDLRQGYHQLMLDPQSRGIATFSTPWGNFRPKRLVFGAKASQDLFDEVMQRIFGDIPRCLNQRDDILLGGCTWEEHNQTLEMVLQRAEDYGVTLNQEKCEFGQEHLDFYGFKFSREGLKPTPDKVRAIKECTAPQSKAEVRSFLGMTGYLSKFIPRYASLTKPLRELTHKDAKFQWGPEESNAFEKLKESISNEDTMAFFNPTLPIMVRTEASFNQGLSAGLLLRTPKGWQPVHCISRTLTDTEKRYSQTEKDALCVKWAKTRFSIYLLGAPKFDIITAHKPLIPLFNKPTAKLPPRIERWVMDMQDVDYELKYEPGKDEADPLDFLSRHPLPETGSDSTEKMIKAVVEAEHAIVIDKIKAETQADSTLQKLSQRIRKGDWKQYSKDPDISPFCAIKEELYEAQGLILRMDRIVIPTNLQRKIIKVAHRLGHLGTTKTKQMIRAKYWFPNMNTLIDQMIGQCYECQVTTKQHREEPIKPTVIPQEPWEHIAVDFGGPYPDGHYNLVAIDKRTRYPEVETTPSTGTKPTTEKMKRMFAHNGTPRRVDSDNGPPFNSKDFAEFARQEGFQHHRITPLHPRANGEAERFMQLLNKTEQIVHLQGKDKPERNMAIQDMLIAYRDTPHPATGVTPYKAMSNRNIRTKLDYTTPTEPSKRSNQDKLMDQRDNHYKQKMKQEGRNTKEHNFILGDYVLLKQRKHNKWSTPFEPAFYVIIKINGSSVTVRRITDG